MRASFLAIASIALLASAASAQTFTIDFNDLAANTIVSNQYAGTTGATFSPGGFSGAGGPTGTWATNTGLGVTPATGGDVGGLGGTATSGNLLHRFNADWIAENGDSVFTINFATPITSFSATFLGMTTPSSSRIFAFDAANTQIGLVSATTTGVQTIGLTNLANATRVIITPGDFNDWVGVDDVNFTLASVAAAPEPGSLALLGLGSLGGFALLRRRVK